MYRDHSLKNINKPSYKWYFAWFFEWDKNLSMFMPNQTLRVNNEKNPWSQKKKQEILNRQKGKNNGTFSNHTGPNRGRPYKTLGFTGWPVLVDKASWSPFSFVGGFRAQSARRFKFSRCTLFGKLRHFFLSGSFFIKKKHTNSISFWERDFILGPQNGPAFVLKKWRKMCQIYPSCLQGIGYSARFHKFHGRKGKFSSDFGEACMLSYRFRASICRQLQQTNGMVNQNCQEGI